METVYLVFKETGCSKCQQVVPTSGMILLNEAKQPVCLHCAGLDTLVFLPSGDTALSRRAGRHSTRAAVVLQWSKSRKRNERRGLLVEEEALARAQAQCAADEEKRTQRRERDSVRRERLDQEYIRQFAARVRQIYPGGPPGVEQIIAEHACEKHSGRVGRTAAAKELDDRALRNAVIAHIRHTCTGYDALLAQGVNHKQARALIRSEVEQILERWRG